MLDPTQARYWWLLLLGSAIIGAEPALPLTFINHGRLPVHRTLVALDADELARRLGLPPGTPLNVVGDHPVAQACGTRAGRQVLMVQVGLDPDARDDLRITAASRWPATLAVASAELRAATGKAEALSDGVRELDARLDNGAVEVRFGRDGWRFGFGAPGKGLVRGGHLQVWVDDQDRGRIANSDPRQLGLAGLVGSTLVKAGAEVRADGTAVVELERRMGGLAAAMRVTETWELPPGQPVLVCRMRWENTGERPLWLAYVGSGDGVKGSWLADELMPGPLIERQKTPLLGDLNGAETRPAWLGGLCRISMESPASGCGVGLSTVLPTPGAVGQGSMIWGCGGGGFQCNLIDPAQGQFPFRVEPHGTLRNGIAVLAAQAGASVFRDTVALWKALAKDQPATLSSPVAVYLAGEALAAQPLDRLEADAQHLAGDDRTRRVAMRLDLDRQFACTIAAPAATAATPVTVLARPLDPLSRLRAVTLGTLAGAEPLRIPLNQALGWSDEVAFTLEASGPLAGLRVRLDEVMPQAPEPMSPLPDATFTDLATMFRWKAIPLVVDYELQWSSDPGFGASTTIRLSTSDPWPWYLPPTSQLPPGGRYHWRVRGRKGDVIGAWSPIRGFTVTTDRTTTPVARPLSAGDPLFTIEASKVTDFTAFHPDIPDDLAPHIGIVAEGYVGAGLTIDRFARGLEALPYRILVRSHHPTWVALPDLEWLCQHLPNFYGIQGGETLSMLYREDRGPAVNGDADYHRRMTMICAKYGKIYHEADGTYRDDKWQELWDRRGDFVRAYGPWLVLSQKNNIIRRQFYSQSAAYGLWLGGITHQHGAWEDGGFYWQNAGFGELGQNAGERKGVLKTMPQIFWALVEVLGISRGCGIYSLDGQTLMVSPKERERFPDQIPRAVIWDTTGRMTETFHRYVAPVIRASVQHHLIPTREELLAQTRLAVFNDLKGRGDAAAWPHYAEYGPLYAGTYGFRTMGAIDGQLWEFIPNTGRYGFIPVLLPGAQPPAAHVRVLPLSQLQDVATVRALFDAAYPRWYDGDAFVARAGDTVTALTSRENSDVAESFAVPLPDTVVEAVSGTLPPQAYVLMRREDAGRRLWLQANAEARGREIALDLHCAHRPRWTIVPDAAATTNRWDEAAHAVHLVLSVARGAVEATVE